MFIRHWSLLINCCFSKLEIGVSFYEMSLIKLYIYFTDVSMIYAFVIDWGERCELSLISSLTTIFASVCVFLYKIMCIYACVRGCVCVRT